MNNVFCCVQSFEEAFKWRRLIFFITNVTTYTDADLMWTESLRWILCILSFKNIREQALVRIFNVTCCMYFICLWPLAILPYKCKISLMLFVVLWKAILSEMKNPPVSVRCARTFCSRGRVYRPFGLTTYYWVWHEHAIQ